MSSKWIVPSPSSPSLRSNAPSKPVPPFQPCWRNRFLLLDLLAPPHIAILFQCPHRACRSVGEAHSPVRYNALWCSCLRLKKVAHLTCNPNRLLWSENTGYPQIQRTTQTYPQANTEPVGPSKTRYRNSTRTSSHQSATTYKKHPYFPVVRSACITPPRHTNSKSLENSHSRAPRTRRSTTIDTPLKPQPRRNRPISQLCAKGACERSRHPHAFKSNPNAGARRTSPRAQDTKRRPAEAGLPYKNPRAESLHNNIVVTVSLSNARST